MLQVHNLHRTFGVDVVLSDVGFTLNDGEHAGLIGPNGVGKSTLLRCIVGQEVPDSGAIVLAPTDQAIGYLPQSLADLTGATVGEALSTARSDLAAADADLRRATDLLAQSPHSTAALSAYGVALTRFESLGGYEREHRNGEILTRLGLAGIDPNLPVAALSGGQKTRLGLATLLLRSPDLLLLDEPTNHLDVDALEWLESFVRNYPGSALIASHDREFLDRTVTRILFLDPTARSLRSYPGSYRAFAAARERERQTLVETWKRQEEYVEQVERDVARLKGEAVAIERSTTSRQPNVRRLARKKARLAKSRERKLERFLESDERVEKPKLGWGLKLDFGPPPSGSRSVLRLEDVSYHYPGRPPLFAGVTFDVHRGQRVALVGPNGAGKTTLLRLISGELSAIGGQVFVAPAVRVGVMSQEQETLDPSRTVLETVLSERPLSETEARDFLHFFLFAGDAAFREVGACSLGERSRLQLARLVLRGCDLLLLDEPLNHLDVESREHFAAALDAFPGTVVAISHDRAFLRHFAERAVEIRDGRARVVESSVDHGATPR